MMMNIEKNQQINPTDDMVTGSEALIRALQDSDVEYIFGYPGGAVLHIYDAIFKQQKILHVLVRHEQAASHMADGYARATGRPGVVLVTSGPGATNTLTGIATAHMDSIPMVVLSGQVGIPLIGTDAFQETDMTGISRPIVKHSFFVKEAEQIPAIIKKAFYIASSGRPGPVVVDIPKDMTAPSHKFQYYFPTQTHLRSYIPVKQGSINKIQQAVDLILASRNPIIYSGGGVVQGNAEQELIELVDLLNFPITETLMGLGAFPGKAKQNLGMLGMHGCYQANMAMHHSDLILALGSRFDDRITNNTSKFCKNAKIIHIDIDPASINKIIKVDVPIVGDLKPTLKKLLQLLRDKIQNKPDIIDRVALQVWWQKIDEWRTKHGLNHNQANLRGKNNMILPQQVIQTVYQITQGDAYITSDVGQHQMFAAQYYMFNKPRRWINSGGLGTMGFGLPAAMGVLFAYPDKQVVCITGEGSIQMNIQELSTCKQYNLPVKIININNQALGMVKQWQDMEYEGRHSQSTYQNSIPNFVELVTSYGHKGFQIEDTNDLKPTLEKVFSAEYKDQLVFVDINVDPSEHVYPMAVRGGAMNEMYISKKMRV